MNKHGFFFTTKTTVFFTKNYGLFAFTKKYGIFYIEKVRCFYIEKVRYFFMTSLGLHVTPE